MNTTQEAFLDYARDLIEELSKLAVTNDCRTLHYILGIAAAEASGQRRKNGEQAFAGAYLKTAPQM